MQLCGRLTTPPPEEVALVTNSACRLLPEDNRTAFRARRANLGRSYSDQIVFSRLPARDDVPSRDSAWEFAGRLLKVLNSPPDFAAQTLSAPGRFVLAS